MGSLRSTDQPQPSLPAMYRHNFQTQSSMQDSIKSTNDSFFPNIDSSAFTTSSSGNTLPVLTLDDNDVISWITGQSYHKNNAPLQANSGCPLTRTSPPITPCWSPNNNSTSAFTRSLWSPCSNINSISASTRLSNSSCPFGQSGNPIFGRRPVTNACPLCNQSLNTNPPFLTGITNGNSICSFCGAEQNKNPSSMRASPSYVCSTICSPIWPRQGPMFGSVNGGPASNPCPSLYAQSPRPWPSCSTPMYSAWGNGAYTTSCPQTINQRPSNYLNNYNSNSCPCSRHNYVKTTPSSGCNQNRSPCSPMNQTGSIRYLNPRVASLSQAIITCSIPEDANLMFPNDIQPPDSSAS